MAYSIRNIYTKNYWNPTASVKIIISGWVVSFFWETSVVQAMHYPFIGYFTGLTAYGIKTCHREMSIPPTIQQSIALIIFMYICLRALMYTWAKWDFSEAQKQLRPDALLR